MGKCEECDKEAVMFEEDGTGYCYEHTIAYAKEQLDRQSEEEETGISELDIIDRAMQKNLSLADAKEELLNEVKLRSSSHD